MRSRAHKRLGVAGPRAPKTEAATLMLEWRARRGISQQAASDALGLTVSQIKALEGGRSRLTPTLRILMALLDRLDGVRRDRAPTHPPGSATPLGTPPDPASPRRSPDRHPAAARDTSAAAR